jgi:hypothetical protein
MYIYYYIATLLTWPNPHPVVCYDCILDLWIVNEWTNESDLLYDNFFAVFSEPETYELLMFMFHSHIHFLLLAFSKNSLQHFITWRSFYGKGLLTPYQTSKLHEHPLLVVCKCLLNTLTDTLPTCQPFPPSETWCLSRCGNKKLTYHGTIYLLIHQ